jgi:hypothetical protein
LTTGEYRQKKRTLKKLPKERLWEAIDQATENSPTMPEFISRLKDQGIDAQVKYTRGGEAKGISYKVDKIAFSGTKLGSAYTFPGLQKHRKVSYESDRDDEAIKELNLRPPAELNDTQPPQAQLLKISAEQREKAEQVYPIAWKIFQRAFRQGKALEEIPGTWSYRGENYALYHSQESERFLISHRERGELARFESGELQSAQAIQQQDLEILRRHDEAQQQELLFLQQQLQNNQLKHKEKTRER